MMVTFVKLILRIASNYIIIFQVNIDFEERMNIPELEQWIEVRCPAR